MTDAPLRILIADDHPVVLHGLAAITGRHPHIQVVAQASDGRSAVSLYRQHQPDVALLDLRMPEIGGVEAIGMIRAEFPTARIIVLTIYDTDEDIYRGLQLGAMAYLLKDTPPDELLNVIFDVAAGKQCIPPEIALKLANRITRPALTKRELEVLTLIVQGQSNREISDSLTVAEGTVRAHVNNILAKLDVRDRTQAATLALKQGLCR
ncbi:MAG: response regulator transcription factor [Cyanobacteria bacterium P01_A01_bin.15]